MYLMRLNVTVFIMGTTPYPLNIFITGFSVNENIPPAKYTPAMWCIWIRIKRN